MKTSLISSKVVAFPVDVNAARFSEGVRLAWFKRRVPSISSPIKLLGSNLETNLRQRSFGRCTRP
eukprot:2608015-Pyramimonas_sp.AAC.1